MTKIPIIKTTDGNYWLMFEEGDVKKACTLTSCEQESIEECVANMKTNGDECIICYVNLMNEVKATPRYRKVGSEELRAQEMPDVK